MSGVSGAQDSFSEAENSAIDAVLMHIQGALLTFGFVPVDAGKGKPNAHYVVELIPNTDALARYLERKQRENPKIKEFAMLRAQAKTLAEQVKLAAPAIPIASSRLR